MGAHHAHRDGTPRDTREVRRLTYVIIAPLALITLALLIWLWPPSVEEPAQQGAAEQTHGQVVSVDPEPCPEEFSEPGDVCGTADVKLSDGERAGDTVTAPLPLGIGAVTFETGDDVVLMEIDQAGETTYSVVDHQRSRGMWVLAIAFVLAVVAFGRWRGLTALAGLAVTFLVLLFFVVPAIIAGSSPLLVAIVGSAAIVLTVLYLTHGFRASTTVALLGTLAALVITGVLSSLSVAALHLTGVTDDVTTSVGLSLDVNMEGLLLAGIVIGSLGVLDDVTVTQSVTVAELARANPAYTIKDLFVAGTRVGRSHIASVVNTIVLAYAGSSLPLMILIVASNDSLGGVLTDQLIAQEIVRSAVATLGLIAAVPITTGLAAFAAKANPGPAGARTAA